jgi:hypothetical protein
MRTSRDIPMYVIAFKIHEHKQFGTIIHESLAVVNSLKTGFRPRLDCLVNCYFTEVHHLIILRSL